MSELGFRLPFSLNGTGGRAALLVWTVVFQASAVAIVVVGPLEASPLWVRIGIYTAFGFGFSAWLAAVVRRLHQMGQSGWYAPLFPIPVIGIGFLLWALFAQTRPVDPTRYAPQTRYVLGSAILICLALGIASRAFWAVHRMPSAHMSPTFEVSDLFVSLVSAPRADLTGKVVTYVLPDADGAMQLHVSRIIASEGQAFAMREGVPVVDGAAALHERVDCPVPGATCLKETLATGASYLVRKDGNSPWDTQDEVIVPIGAFAVLGDNRDAALDSRQTAPEGGHGFIPAASLRGRAVALNSGGL